jgi:hypothetical protein
MTFAQVREAHGVRSWRKVRGYPQYRVTSCGRVWSMKHEKFIRFDYNLGSYIRVELYNRGKRKEKNGFTWFFVHRLVGEHYKKKRPGCTEINHKDWDRHNNNAPNLEWVTKSENAKHAKQKFNSRVKYLGAGRWKKLTYEQVLAESGAPF